MRARNLKPSFFTNEDLADCAPLARILFAGLWCYADREGRFEWRPRRIKAEILPYDDCEIEKLLEELRRKGFILKYTVNSRNHSGEFTQQLRRCYGWIPSFHKHAAPHHTEKQSELPAPPDDVYEQNQGFTESTASSTVNSRNHLRENPPDSLNPDSLNPDSLNPDSKTLSASECDAASCEQSDGEFILTRKKRKLRGKKLLWFLEFWDAFDYKKGRAEAADTWLEIPDLTENLVKEIVVKARIAAKVRPGLIRSGKTPKMAQGWLSGRRWEDQVGEIKQKTWRDTIPPI